METRKAGHARAVLIVLAAALGFGAVVWGVNRASDPAPAPGPATATAVPAAPAPEAAVPGEPQAAKPAPAAAPAPAEAPRFDVVRVAPDGSVLVAGTAEPGAEVTIFADAAPLAAATADADGNFVAMFRAEPSAAPQALTLEAGNLRSDETVMLLPEAPAAPGEGAAVPSGDAPAASGPTAAPGIAATVIVGPDRVEALPAPGSGGRVTLGSIDYAEAGEVTLAGVGTAGSVLRAYVDGRLAEETAVGGDGRWSLALDDVAAGLYRLRIDQIGADGRVVSRVETPFQRDFPRAPLPRPGETAPGQPRPGGAITVQPGSNLWTIARERYGSGVLYTQIFTANHDLIRDPSLIYPGQIFAMPEVEGAAPPETTGPMPRHIE